MGRDRGIWAAAALICGLAGCGAGDESDGGRPRGSMSPTTIAGAGGAAPSTGAAANNGFGNPMQGGGGRPMMPAMGAAGNSNICEVIHVTASPQVPDMMIVLDRSGSMGEGGRWMPSVSALRRVTMELQSRIRFGLAMFPDASADVSGAVNACLTAPDPLACLLDATAMLTPQAVCAPGGIVVPIAIDNAPAIDQALTMTGPAGGTPTPETLQGLLGTFAASSTDPDAMTRAKFILLVTDGQPTCPAGNGMDTTPPDIDASNAAIDALTQSGVHTYVIGYDTTGPGNEMLATVLDGFAQRGGTGDTMHRPVEDEQSLLTELQEITGDVASCTFLLDKAPPRADFVLVRVDGQQINLGEADGWELIGDRSVELKGATCVKVKDGGQHSIDVEVRCSVVVPQ